ncbi:MAG: transcriptional initiation protein Tat, partial [Myxococcaceae bacterium]|nr:transcriptional initiation protein Tat [Myxococcaceae bacterium]
MSDDSTSKKLGRRRVLKGLGAASAALAFPHVWIPRPAFAQSTANGTVRHLVYIRLSGGFRFSCAFNGDVADQFNPFGPAGQRANGTEWGVSSLLERSDTWLAGDANEARRTLGMRPVNQLSNEMCVLPSVDHEPFSNRADGNHG